MINLMKYNFDIHIQDIKHKNYFQFVEIGDYYQLNFDCYEILNNDFDDFIHQEIDQRKEEKSIKERIKKQNKFLGMHK